VLPIVEKSSVIGLKLSLVAAAGNGDGSGARPLDGAVFARGSTGEKRRRES
jgi:hypothetical protein